VSADRVRGGVYTVRLARDDPQFSVSPPDPSRVRARTPGGGWRECVECGDPFRCERADAKYCSGACRMRAFRRRHPERQRRRSS
jgi:hypothetical protein